MSEVLEFMKRRWDNIKTIREKRMGVWQKRMGVFDHPFFRKAPAMYALKDIAEPKPEHVRACLMEIARHLLSFHGEVPKAENQYCVVVTVNDEPPKPPTITGVFGPFTEKQADQWVEVKKKEFYKKDTFFCITPIDRG